jgi:hypothetical protein
MLLFFVTLLAVFSLLGAARSSETHQIQVVSSSEIEIAWNDSLLALTSVSFVRIRRLPDEKCILTPPLLTAAGGQLRSSPLTLNSSFCQGNRYTASLTFVRKIRATQFKVHESFEMPLAVPDNYNCESITDCRLSVTWDLALNNLQLVVSIENETLQCEREQKVVVCLLPTIMCTRRKPLGAIIHSILLGLFTSRNVTCLFTPQSRTATRRHLTLPGQNIIIHKQVSSTPRQTTTPVNLRLSTTTTTTTQQSFAPTKETYFASKLRHVVYSDQQQLTHHNNSFSTALPKIAKIVSVSGNNSNNSASVTDVSSPPFLPLIFAVSIFVAFVVAILVAITIVVCRRNKRLHNMTENGAKSKPAAGTKYSIIPVN